MQIYAFNDLKYTLKLLKRSYMFRSYDHPQGAYVAQRTSIARLILNSTRLTQYTRHAATAPTQRKDLNHWVFLNCNFSKEQSMLPEDDRMIETCRSVLRVLM